MLVNVNMNNIKKRFSESAQARMQTKLPSSSV